MKLGKTQFNNLKDFLDYLYSSLYINYISTSLEFKSISIKKTLMNFHVYVLPKGFTFKSNEEVNAVMSKCISLDTYTQVIIGNNIRINSNITLTPPKRCKGLVIYDKGTLSNLGSISMYARGCIAEGQDIYLTDTEFIPATGASGGKGGVGNSFNTCENGHNGNNGILRQSGGGGGGGKYLNSAYNSTSGNGSNGTSFSGGSGGGGYAGSGGTTVGPNAKHASSNGGSGGYASTYSSIAGGGQGNPSGASTNESIFPSGQIEGTGGLLIIYCKDLYNIGNIDCNGVFAKYATSRIGTTGGSSGGGSLNIFCDKLYNGINKGQIVSNGGPSQTVNTNNYGGAGGNGCVTIDAIKTYTEDNYDESIYNDNEYVEIPEIITEEQEFDSKYIIHDFLYNGHNHQSFIFEPDTEYTIECWGARGGSDDGDDYPNIVKGSYGNYICARYITSASTTADMIIGESGSPGGGGWPDGASSVSEWGVNDPKRFYNKPAAGGSTTLNINNVKAITVKGGNSGTAEIIGTSSNHRITLDMSLVNDSVKNTLTCNCEINGHSGKFYNVLQKEWKSILIFCSQSSSSTGNHDRITFTWNALTDSSFMEFRIVRPTNQTNRLPELYDAYIYGAGPSGSIWMDCATSTMYAVQIKTSMLASFECSLLDSLDVEYNYPLFYFGSDLTSDDIVENHLVPSYRVLNEGFEAAGPVNSTSTDYVSSDIERINVSKTIPDIAGYHGMIRISELSKEYIYTSDNDDTIEFTGKQEKLILIPDKLGNRYVNTKFLLECHGASSFNGVKGSCIKGNLIISNPLTLFCKIGNKPINITNEAFNNTYELYDYNNGSYVIPTISGGNTSISISNSSIDVDNVLINCSGGNQIDTNEQFIKNISISGYKYITDKYEITYSNSSSTSTSGSIKVADTDSNKNNETAPCVLIIIPKVAGTAKIQSWKIDGYNDSRVVIRNNNDSVITYSSTYGSPNVSASVNVGTIYKFAVGTYYVGMNYYVERSFTVTYPESYVYLLINNKMTIVDNNIVYQYTNTNYIDNGFRYNKQFRNLNPLLSIINEYNDQKEYFKFTSITDCHTFSFSLTNVSSYKAFIMIRKRNGYTYGRVSGTTNGRARIYVNSSYMAPTSSISSSYGDNRATNDYFMNTWSGQDAIYICFGGMNSNIASYTAWISDTTLYDILIPVNGVYTSIYSLVEYELKKSNIVYKNHDIVNYVSPLLTDVSISQSNIDGNGAIYIKKLPIDNDDYILNPDAIKVTERQ